MKRLLLLLFISQAFYMPAQVANVLLDTPVLIQTDSSQASGFFLLSKDRVKLFFVTARHVIYNPHTNSISAKYAELIQSSVDPKIVGKHHIVMDLQSLKLNGKIRSSEKYDVLVIELGDMNTHKYTDSIAQIDTFKNKLFSPFGQNIIKKYDEVLIGYECFIHGYPHSIGLKQFPQFDYSKPILRKGVIAGKYDYYKTIIIDCPSYPGNSGGPVIQVEPTGDGFNFEIIGIVTQFIPIINDTGAKFNSGYSVCASMDAIIELIENYSTK